MARAGVRHAGNDGLTVHETLGQKAAECGGLSGDRALDRAPDRAPDRVPDQTPDSAPDSAPDSVPGGRDWARWPWLARWLRSRTWQFQVILPNQILFWVVIVVGLVGPNDPGLNFATAVTWFVWFCLVFVLIVMTGRGWCAVCPFGGLAEGVQRRALWHRPGARRPLGVNRPFPDRVGRYGYLIPVATFAVLTWIEEFFDIAGPGDPPLTSVMVLGIIILAVASFLVFERRAFCRYLCPLSTLIGALGQQAPVAGFRARDRRVCEDCTTKDCLHGNDRGYGCPWFDWPGSVGTNLNCGLCGECFRTCPSDNVGLFATRPLRGLTRGRRRADVAWAVAWLAGIGVFQQVNALDSYVRLDAWLNSMTSIPHYPNPLDYAVITVLVVLLAATPAWMISRTLLRPGLVMPDRADTFVYRVSRFRTVFLPLMYAAIPLVSSDYLARQLPKFLANAAKVIPAAGDIVGLGAGVHSPLMSVTLAGPSATVMTQLAVVATGTAVSVVLAVRTVRVELRTLVRAPALASGCVAGFMAVAGVLIGWLYVVVQGAA